MECKRNENLDILRGVLAILVVYGHIGYITEYSVTTFYENELYRFVKWLFFELFNK